MVKKQPDQTGHEQDSRTGNKIWYVTGSKHRRAPKNSPAVTHTVLYDVSIVI